MAGAQRFVAVLRRPSSLRRGIALLVAGAIALLVATTCGRSLGYQTPCSTWISMDSSDQRSTVINIFQQGGPSNPSNSDISDFERLASAYCSDPYANDDTIGGLRDSRAGP
jgi:hypothetical protein